MAIWAIGDPHLSKAQPKPMDIFGPAWQGHPERFFANWQRTVDAGDTVLVVGDISWAMRLDEALPDLQDLDALPGRKVLIQGNHDYWWQSISRVRRLPLSSMTFLQNDSVMAGEWAVCGTRGWLCPGAGDWDADPDHNQAIYARELLRLGLSLDHARKAGAERIICMLHYPPVAQPGVPTGFTERLEQAGVSTCVYGHLHAIPAGSAFEGDWRGVHYRCVAADYVDFTPVLIAP